MANRFQRFCWVLPGLLLAAVLPVAAQLEVGDNLKMNLNGILSGGYNGVYGNQINSSHGMSVGGNGTLSGFYYNPNFLSFNLSPYYGQSRQNSDFRSLFNTGGFNFTSNIFGGSRFPGSFGFSKSWDSEGNFSMPGLPNYTTRGSGQGFNIGWSALVPDYPSLTVTFTDGSSEYSLLGSPQNGSSDYRHLDLHSGYQIAGFNLGAYYDLGYTNTSTPEVFGTQTTAKVNSDDNSFGFNASHRLPMQGAFSASFNRSNLNTDYLGYRYRGTVDTVSASAGFNPIPKLNFSITSGYNDNLAGTLFQAITSGQPVQAGDQSGGLFQQSEMSSHSFFVAGYGSYKLTNAVQLQADAQHRQQSFLGNSYSANIYGGGVTYVHTLLGGFLGASLNLMESNTSYIEGHALSFSTNVNYSRSLGSWVLAGGFSYAQNVQAFLVTYMNSYYTYSGNVRRRFFDRLVWSAAAAGSRSALTNDPHTGNSSQSYSTGLGVRRFNVSGTYAKSDGYGLLGVAGLTQPANQPPGTIPPEWLILYGGHSYGVGLGATPARRLSIGASFSRAWSNTSTGGIGSMNHVEQINAILNYQLRKLTFTTGYGRLLQGFTASGTPPSDVNSFYVGLSRSFNFF
jgi:hypothetical protein